MKTAPNTLNGVPVSGCVSLILVRGKRDEGDSYSPAEYSGG